MENAIYAVLKGTDLEGEERLIICVTGQSELEARYPLDELSCDSDITDLMTSLDCADGGVTDACTLVTKDLYEEDDVKSQVEEAFSCYGVEVEYSKELEEAMAGYIEQFLADFAS